MKGKFAVIVSFIFVFVAAIGTGIFVNYYNNSDKVIRLDEEAEGETVAFTCENMYPGQVYSSDYKIISAFEGDVAFSFVEGDENDLIPYLEAEIKVDGSCIYSGSLEQLMGATVASQIKKDGSDFSVSYWISFSADNAAQGLSAKFYVDINIRR